MVVVTEVELALARWRFALVVAVFVTVVFALVELAAATTVGS